ncbi:MAG: TMEM175 family protein [Caldilinea sp.]|uniref:TMEM175 family protein n=1 Tax=Caldilinea sp. TaxID=2293560 RepID=UPI002C90B497|nr:DUF1211 domain-containing protein [Anaerolineales bacterium]HQY92394.1 TMEM175 family protein [Caldilinea sp.]HRA68025.1 TMEM175 family protein [Caldilinea sp.]
MAAEQVMKPTLEATSPIPQTPDTATDSAKVEQNHLGLERLVFFSDAVFAIAITLLALEVRLPVGEGDLSNTELLHDLLAIWPKYLSYTISFLVIGAFWLGHHRRFLFIKRYDRNLLFLNMMLLMVIAFIPFPTSVISEYGNQVATIFYAATIVVAGLFSGAIWWYASYHDRLIDPAMDSRQRRRERLQTLAMPGIFLLSIGLALINDDLAKASWSVVAIVALLIR